ncbi:hypothetical protein TELCIR_01201 [Teladorsagia circumcincta]|uniref:CC domain-containing protein n=1 Tax=Teladorsagia circumcincta TaxID=45464 RepID=A0A2G9V4Q5_TELCI|nr:hypothetical protein TELCIR_01201 [Teladorsagia circumcincta]
MIVKKEGTHKSFEDTLLSIAGLILPSIAKAPTLINDSALLRHKRQTYYLCGVFPNQYYSKTAVYRPATMDVAAQYPVLLHHHRRADLDTVHLDSCRKCDAVDVDNVREDRRVCPVFAVQPLEMSGMGICPSGYTCQSNGFCCPQCPNNVMPFGTCRNAIGKRRRNLRARVGRFMDSSLGDAASSDLNCYINREFVKMQGYHHRDS